MPSKLINGQEITEAELQSIESAFKTVASSSNQAERAEAASKILKAIEAPIRKVLLSGDLVGGVYTPVDFTTNPHVMFPLDLITPGGEREFYAYTIPDHGDLPTRRVEGDYLMIPTYMIANAVGCTLKFLRDANWPVINRMIEILEAGVIKKRNDDGWQTIIAAATDRNILVNDAAAAAGQFTPRLIALTKTFMRRNGGGNTATLNRSKLTDLFVSPESKDDIRAWGLDLVADRVRDNIYYSNDNGSELMRLFEVNIHDMDELGVDQEYQLYYTQTLAGSLASGGDLELGIGVDLQRNDSFVMPVRQEFELFEDNTLHRKGEFGVYGRAEQGFSVLDSRRTILVSI